MTYLERILIQKQIEKYVSHLLNFYIAHTSGGKCCILSINTIFLLLMHRNVYLFAHQYTGTEGIQHELPGITGIIHEHQSGPVC